MSPAKRTTKKPTKARAKAKAARPKPAKRAAKAKAPAKAVRKATARPGPSKERAHCIATDPFGDPCQSAPRLPSKYCTIHSYLEK